MKKKVILSIAFIISLLPMLMSQYGYERGIQEIAGTMNLFNVIGMLSIVLYITGVWVPTINKNINRWLCIIGLLGIIISEIYNFLTWYIEITGEISIENSIMFAYPEFYIGFVSSVVMVIFYFIVDRFLKE